MRQSPSFPPSAQDMELASSASGLDAGVRSRPQAERAIPRDAAVVLQVDGAVSGINGLAWLLARRDGSAAHRLETLQAQAVAEGWSQSELSRAALACLRPRRAEVNALGAAYRAALTPGVIDAAHRMRRAGTVVELSGEVAVEALLGVAEALGVTPDAIHAPHLRFDALGAYTGCDAGERSATIAHGYGPTDRPRRVFVGTGPAERLADVASDVFVRFTGVVAHEGPARGAHVGSFGELAELVIG